MKASAASWTAAYQAPPSVGFSRQEYWSGVPLQGEITMHDSLYFTNWVSLVAQTVKKLAAMWETGFNPGVRKIPWRRA